jgi:hypothetical protein
MYPNTGQQGGYFSPRPNQPNITPQTSRMSLSQSYSQQSRQNSQFDQQHRNSSTSGAIGELDDHFRGQNQQGRSSGQLYRPTFDD